MKLTITPGKFDLQCVRAGSRHDNMVNVRHLVRALCSFDQQSEILGFRFFLEER